ncbi:hypothetical protein HUT19_02415 [Streptomyces sp. NA02950]|nr:hypothetical protein HUT19_02415 [Streptomyces sp. NA02950]
MNTPPATPGHEGGVDVDAGPQAAASDRDGTVPDQGFQPTLERFAEFGRPRLLLTASKVTSSASQANVVPVRPGPGWISLAMKSNLHATPFCSEVRPRNRSVSSRPSSGALTGARPP